MVTLRTASERPCVEGCNGEWIRAALEILESNEINRYIYAFNLRNLFSKGRSKDRNRWLEETVEIVSLKQFEDKLKEKINGDIYCRKYLKNS